MGTFHGSTTAPSSRYVSSPSRPSGKRCRRWNILTSHGGNFDAAPSVSPTVVGSADLRFDNCQSGVLTYNFTDGSGRTGSIPLTRLHANVSCTADGMNLPPGGNDFKFSGAWYKPATAGQGMVIEVNPNQPFLFGNWFTFHPNGQSIGGPPSQRWYSLQKTFTPGQRQITGIPILENVQSGRFDQATPVPVIQQVGTAGLNFTSCNAATLSYSFTGGTNGTQSGSIALVRVGPTPTGCTY